MKKRLFTVFCVLFLAFTVVFFANLQGTGTPKDYMTSTGYLLNTYVTFTIYDSHDMDILDECMRICSEYDLIFSRTNPKSELYQLNNGLLTSDADGYYTVSDELFTLIKKGKEYSALSNNSFSIALEPLTSLWNFTDGSNRVPSQDALEEALPLLNSEDIQLKEPNQVAFAKEGMGIDLGAIAKGYIADRIKEYLLSEGVNSAIISLGGNVLCVGQKENRPFTVGVEKPFDVDGKLATTLEITNKSVVTSGTYQRYFEKNGKLYHHILDYKTGFPYENELTSVTIVTASSTDADALSTTCFSLGLKKGMELLNSLDNVDGFFITKDGNIHYTDGFLDKYQVKEKRYSTNETTPYSPFS